MSRSICKKGCLFIALAAWCTAALPVFADPPTPPISSASSGWTPANWIALVTALLSGIAGIITAFNASKKADDANKSAASAQSLANANNNSLDRIASRLNEHGNQITNLAQNQLPPSMIAQMQNPTPTGGGGQQAQPPV